MLLHGDDGTLGRLRQIVVSMPLSSLVKMILPQPRFVGCSVDVVLASFESIIFDAVLERDVIIAVLNDIAPGAARRWVFDHDEFASVSLFDSELLVKRKRGTLRSGRSGKRVKSRKQAIAIGLSEARRAGGKVPKRRRRKSSRRKK